MKKMVVVCYLTLITINLQAVNPLFDIKKLARFTVQQLVEQEGKTNALKKIKEFKKYQPDLFTTPFHKARCKLLQFISMSSLEWLITDKLGMTQERILKTIMQDDVSFKNTQQEFALKLKNAGDKQQKAWEKESHERVYKALIEAISNLK